MKKKSRSKIRRKSLMMTGEMPPHCVQCMEPMLYGTNWDKFVPVCVNPECPNYGLLQVGIEKMRELEEGD